MVTILTISRNIILFMLIYEFWRNQFPEAIYDLRYESLVCLTQNLKCGRFCKILVSGIVLAWDFIATSVQLGLPLKPSKKSSLRIVQPRGNIMPYIYPLIESLKKFNLLPEDYPL